MLVHRLRILVVEDNPENMDLMCLLLEREGHETYRAYDGVEGIKAAFRHQPDLILLDLALPQKDGWTVAEELKSDIITQSIPIVAITAHALPKYKEQAMEAGCDGFIIKPFRLATFNRTVKEFSC